jgi:hypothetical protein
VAVPQVVVLVAAVAVPQVVVVSLAVAGKVAQGEGEGAGPAALAARCSYS